MILDRELQREILKAALNAHPDYYDVPELADMPADERQHYVDILLDLEQRGLVKAETVIADEAITSCRLLITEAGIAAIDDDGAKASSEQALSLQHEALRGFIEKLIFGSELSQAKKQEWRTGLGKLDADSIEQLTEELLQPALSDMPARLKVIDKYIARALLLEQFHR